MAITGSGTIPRGVDLYAVVAPAVAADTMIEVTLNSDPGDVAGGAVLECIHKNAGYGFSIQLSSIMADDTTFSYKLDGTRTGTGTILAGTGEHVVTAAGVLTTSLIYVTLTSNPGSAGGGAVLQSVYKNPGYGFTIKLSNSAQNAVTFDYKLAVRTDTGTFPLGRETYYVAEPTVASNSAVTVIFTSDPSDTSGGTSVENIILNAGYGFTVEVNAVIQTEATFDYIVA